MIKICLGLVALVVCLAGCAVSQYDNDVASCTTSNGKISYTVYLSRDSSTTKNDIVTERFLKACKDVGAGVQR